MKAMRAQTVRARHALAGFAAATTLAGVLAAPSAGAAGMNGCPIARHRVHRGDSVTATCAHFPPQRRGSAYAIQKEMHDGKAVYAKYVMARFTTNRRGTAVVHLTIPRKLYIGPHQIYFRAGAKETRDWIRVVRG